MIARQLYNPPAELKKKSDYINLSVQTIADFNNKLDQLNLSSDKIQFKAELEELKKVTEFALGIIEGLKTKNLHEIDLTTSYGRGVACGTFTSSLTSKVSSLLGCTGGVVGYVSSQPWLLVAGAVTALSCFIADAGITVCLSKDVNEKTEQLKNVKVFANDMQKMENFNKCLANLKDNLSGNLPADEYLKKSKKCLKNYRVTCPHQTDQFNKLLSLLYNELPDSYDVSLKENQEKCFYKLKQKKNTLENREIKITEKEEVLNEPKILLRDSYSAFAEYEEPTEENYSQFIGRVKKMFGVVAPVDHIDVVRDQKVYRYTNDTVFKITPK